MLRAFIAVVVCLSMSTSGLLAQDDAPELVELNRFSQLFIADADGGNMKRLFPKFPHRQEGSPCLSEDGKILAFDCWDHDKGEKTSDARVVAVNLEKGTETSVMKGAMPALSPQGHRVFFSRYDNRGVWLASVKSPEEELTLLDDRGWGTAWSPDGKKIAWVTLRDTGRTIAVYDIVEGQGWDVFTAEPGTRTPYQTIYYNFCWSPDSRHLVFKATRDRQSQIVTVDAYDESKSTVLLEGPGLHNSFAWHPGGGHILLSQQHPERNLRQLYRIGAMKPDAEPVLLENLPEEVITSDPCFTPEGKQIIFAARITPPARKIQP